MDIRIPDLAESVKEGDLGAWLKKDGDTVRKDEAILELETDKATVELAAEASGRLEILVQAGETVHVGDVVGRIVEDGAGGQPARGEKPADPGPAKREPEERPERGREEPPPKEPAPAKDAAGKDKPGPATNVNAATWKVTRKVALRQIDMNNAHNMWTDRSETLI